jgi:hypothetical protein
MAVRIEMGTPAEGMVAEEIATRAAVVVEGAEEGIKVTTLTMIARGMIVVEEGAEAGTGVATTVEEGVMEGGRRGVVEP